MSQESEAARAEGIRLYNHVWDLLQTPDRTPAQDERMLHAAHASRFHWEESGCPPVNLARGEWQCSRVYAVLGRADAALHHARRTLEICQAEGIGDFDLFYAHEALARAYAVSGALGAAAAERDRAVAACDAIAKDEDRRLAFDDLRGMPGLPDLS